MKRKEITVNMLSIRKMDEVPDLIKKAKDIKDILEYTENPIEGTQLDHIIDCAKTILDTCVLRLAKKTNDSMSEEEIEKLDLLKKRVWGLIEWEFESRGNKALFLNQ